MYREADFCFDCCHAGLQSVRYVSLVGANRAHSAILLIAPVLMNEKMQLLEIGRSGRELLSLFFFFRSAVDFEGFPQKQTRGKAELHPAQMEPHQVTPDLDPAPLRCRTR